MGNIVFNHTREGKNRVRITPKIGKLPTLQEYIEEAKSILNNELKTGEEEKLKDPSSQDFSDSMLLIHEFKEDFEIKRVVFSHKTGDIEVTCDNISQIPSIVKRLEQNGPNRNETHITAIREAVAEALEK